MKLRTAGFADAILRVAGLVVLVAMATAYGYSIAQFAGSIG